MKAGRPTPSRTRGRVALALAATTVLALAPAAGAALTPLAGIAAGGDNTCAIYFGGAYCWGANENGQVGNNSTETALAPAPVVGLNAGVTAITTSGAHSCAVAGGAAWCWGNNDYGQLGNDSLVDSPVPVPVAGLSSGVTAISAGDLHTCAVVNGGVKCWGSGGLGQLGNGATTFSARTPVDTLNLAGVTEVSAGASHTCAIAPGMGLCWGRGDSGEVGSGGSLFINPSPVNVVGFAGVFSDVIETIDAGGSFACATKDGGATYCWGLGSNGQIGNGANANAPAPLAVSTLGAGVTAISAGTGLHACAVASGALMCWGLNNQGQLGNPSFPGGSNVPVAVQGLASGVQKVAAGGLHTCAIAADGLHCWGGNANGQLGTGGQVGSATPIRVIDAQLATTLSANPATVDFGGQSLLTTSPPQVITITNNGGTTVTFTDAATSAAFGGATACVSLVAGASCTVSVQFTPTAPGAIAGALILETSAGLVGVELAGAGELSLVTHYYRSILRRAPDAGGKAFWSAEATRTAQLGSSVNEAWFAMAQAFFGSAEYTAFNRDNSGFVTDLYNTFFNRAPDAGGLAFWKGQLDAGMPREVALASFMFSGEFVAFTTAIFGNTAARAEVNAVMDFYRGLLARLPDNDGFAFWAGRFRQAQCQGQAAIVAQAESISSGFATSGEYAGRGRSNSQYVGDLYNAFLRRGGDLAGVQFWINQLGSGALTREQVRAAFKDSAEFQARVNAIIAEGCIS
jgi:alpha-tubulin suppressor-like RCC1 family protein